MEYERLPTGDAPTADVVRRARAVIGRPGLLAHPTSTTYGLGARPRELDAEIARLKGRTPERPLLRIAGDREGLRSAHPELVWTDRAERLASRFWPGPLTLVLDDGTETGLAVRVEAHPVTGAVLRGRPLTLSSTSLNRSGEPPARTPEAAASTMDAMPATDRSVLWLDAGSLPPSPPSTLLSLLGDRPRLLRAGAVPTPEIEACLGGPLEASMDAAEGQEPGRRAEGERAGRQTGMQRLLFVCSGNTCRSPLAEALARRRASDAGYPEAVSCRSAGAFAGHGVPASDGARLVAREHGLSLENHASSPLDEELVGWADVVLCMSPSHVRAAEEMGGEGKTRLLTDFLPEGHPDHRAPVHDPHGGGREVYRETFELLEEAVRGLLQRLLPGPEDAGA